MYSCRVLRTFPWTFGTCDEPRLAGRFAGDGTQRPTESSPEGTIFPAVLPRPSSALPMRHVKRETPPHCKDLYLQCIPRDKQRCVRWCMPDRPSSLVNFGHRYRFPVAFQHQLFDQVGMIQVMKGKMPRHNKNPIPSI